MNEKLLKRGAVLNCNLIENMKYTDDKSHDYQVTFSSKGESEGCTFYVKKNNTKKYNILNS